jgi:V8-like Glu-specific endopeptidase
LFRWLKGRREILALAATAATLCGFFITPTAGGASDLISRFGRAVGNLAGTSARGRPAGTVAAVGALFTTSNGKLNNHFCTASVVHSPGGNLAVTAAHCVTGVQAPLVFVPGYAEGNVPYGVWRVTRVYTDQAWRSSASQDDDVAFLALGNPAAGAPIEDITGAEQLGTGWPMRAYVHVTGYPDASQQPLQCANWTKEFSATQLEFDCGGYTDGTSGGPFLANVDKATQQGTVIGVIGGYEQGGDTPAVSYSPVFGARVQSLYKTATTSG